MISSSALFLVSVCACVALAAWSLAQRIPANLTSLFRYRLWQLRDEIVDGIFNGRIEGTEAMVVLIRQIEEAIVTANRVTLFMVTFSPSLPKAVEEAGQEYRDEVLSKLSEEQRTAYDEYFARFLSVIGRRLGFGSVSSYFMWPVWVFQIAVHRSRVAAVERSRASFGEASASSQVTRSSHDLLTRSSHDLLVNCG